MSEFGIKVKVKWNKVNFSAFYFYFMFLCSVKGMTDEW